MLTICQVAAFETDEHRLTLIEASTQAILLYVFDPETFLGKTK